ncbi:MAG: hypothetical protein ACW98A_12260, partial [Candidatus Hodarchaeales archaeon]
QFFVLTTIAVFFYPGGYLYFDYTFSSLGRVLSEANGAPNEISSVLFMLALFLTPITLIPFWINLQSLFKDSNIEKILSILGSLFGILATILLIGVAIYPTDTQSEIHGLYARLMFLSFATGIVIYSIAILINKDYSNRYAILGFLIFLLVPSYVFDIAGLGTAFVQKIIVYSFIFWALLQVIPLWSKTGKS